MRLARRVPPIYLDSKVCIRGPVAKSEMQIRAALARMAAAAVNLSDQLAPVGKPNRGERA